MQQIVSVWSTLDMRKRAMVIAATVAMFAAVLGLSRMAAAPNFSLLYSGLESGAAGEVVAALEAQGAAYEVRGSAIFVDSARRDEFRMTLARDGLPANGAQGYELLDSLSGFGTTSQMFDAAYWRAKEGELARTIVSSPQIRAARVHISNQNAQPFRREAVQTASVTVTTATGALPAGHARALRFLVASAVAGLDAANVSVIDARSGTILSAEEGPEATAAGTERRAAELRRNVERLLEARVGRGNAVVEVSVETVTEREQITQRTFDPDSRVAISSETEESTTSSSDSRGGGDVTVASNLPDGDAAEDGSKSTNQNSETRERLNYEVSETQREVLRTPGAVKRLSVAVLVNGTATTGADGAEVWAPRPEAEMTALRDLVASAVGLDEARGDTLTLKSMEFTPVEVGGTAAAPALLDRLSLDPMSILQLVVLALVALVLGLFVVRPILAARALPGPAGGNLPRPQQVAALTNAGTAKDEAAALDGEIGDGVFPPSGDMPRLANQEANGDGTADLPALRRGAGDDPVQRLRLLIEDRQDETVEILRSWMEDREEPAR